MQLSTKRRARAAAAIILGPAVATSVALAARGIGSVGAASLYLLSVVAAAAVGGVASGIGAAIVAFGGLNYYFTAPEHTFAVGKIEDLVALLIFLAVAAIVGTLFARAVSARERAARKERETRLLNGFGSALLSGGSLEHALDDLARSSLELFGLIRCEITTEHAKVARVAPGSHEDGARIDVPLHHGTISAVRRAGAPGFTQDEHDLLSAFAAQIGLVLDRERLDVEARAARMDAEVSQMRASLFSSVTHDLRTPLASIKAGVTSLLDREVALADAQRDDLLTTILEETDRLNRLVGNLLNLARARAGALVIDKALVPVEDVVETVLARMKPALDAINVRTVFRPDLPPVWMDPVQMDQALTNILENAARHSPPQSDIQVSVAAWGNGIEVRVTDRGPGVPIDDRERVFEPFFHRDSDRGRGGTGLGLAIARAVVGAHGGKVWIEGAPGGGAAVVIQLPHGSSAS